MSFASHLVAAWYAPRLSPLAAALWPASLVFRTVVAVRRAFYRTGVLRSERVAVPVVIVGNLTVGGSGKTPLVRALVEALAARGWRPGIVSRGYGGTDAGPRAVHPGDDPGEVGDEAPLLAEQGCPVWIGRKRADAARALLVAHPGCNVIVSDDGLQHYALARDVEIAVVDGARGLGNGLLLPAGPLRERRGRLDEVDAVVRLLTAGEPQPSSQDGGAHSVMVQEPLPWRNLVRADAVADPAAWREGVVHAVAGIGNPERFFACVRALGLAPVCHAFPDHHRYAPEDIRWPGATAILMTEKDAVKCAAFADERCWAQPMRARIDPALVDLIERRLRGSQAR
jgi:tetraacyldisaccharide 4'-kinase